MKHYPTAPGDPISVYRVGWWTHHWWPTPGVLRLLATGHQTGRIADDAQAPSRTRVRAGAAAMIARRAQLLRRPHRPWQAEWEHALFCPRALTADGARAKADYDRLHLIATGERSPREQQQIDRKARRAEPTGATP